MDLGVGSIAAVLSPPPGCAQVQAINGSIRGRVLDQTGSPLPQAAVTIRERQTGFTRSF